ncbi:MAG: hypothetical protein DDT33_01686 [Firmicutes bacterium]|nr:hypothetical protein [Bacillota bacterium]
MTIVRHRLRGTVEQNIIPLAEIMRRQIINGIQSPLVRELAEDIIRNATERERGQEIRAIHKWCIRSKKFARDPVKIELLESPRRLAYEYRKKGVIRADCESLSTLQAALLGSLGHRARVVIIDANPRTRAFSHAHTQVKHQGRWIDLDVAKNGAIGWRGRHTRHLIVDPVEGLSYHPRPLN